MFALTVYSSNGCIPPCQYHNGTLSHKTLYWRSPCFDSSAHVCPSCAFVLDLSMSFSLSLSFVGALKCQNWFYRQLFFLSTVVLVLATYLTNSSNLLLIHKSIYTTFYKASIQIIDLTTAFSYLSLTFCAKFSGYKYCHMSCHTGFILHSQE